MNRARVIVKEIIIQKQGEVNFFQIRLPKNVIRLIGIETDAWVISILETSSGGSSPAGENPDGTVATHEVNRTPFLKWNTQSNPVLGKLKLQSMDRSNIFFDAWLPFVLYNSGIPDMSFGLFPISPYTQNQNNKPRTIDITCRNTIINGMFEDSLGSKLNMDMNYKIKVFVWVETSEDAKGVVFDFQQRISSKELEIKI